MMIINISFVDNTLFVRMMTRQLLNKRLNEGDISTREVALLYSAARKFFYHCYTICTGSSGIMCLKMLHLLTLNAENLLTYHRLNSLFQGWLYIVVCTSGT